jgi:hypothetical protein
MGQFSVEKPVAPGSALSGNQQLTAQMFRDDSNPGLERDVKMELIRARTGNPQGEHFTELATSPASPA